MYQVRSLGNTPWNLAVPKEACPEGCKPQLSVLGTIAVTSLTVFGLLMFANIVVGMHKNTLSPAWGRGNR